MRLEIAQWIDAEARHTIVFLIRTSSSVLSIAHWVALDVPGKRTWIQRYTGLVAVWRLGGLVFDGSLSHAPTFFLNR